MIHHRDEIGRILPDPNKRTPEQVKQDDWVRMRKLRMEEMLIKTRGKLDLLVKEAKSYGMHDLLTNAERNRL